jgi:magnesium transporter
MFHVKKDRKQKYGTPPGSVIYTGERVEEPIKLSLIRYNKVSFEKIQLKEIQEFKELKDPKKVNWLVIEGIHKEEIIEQIGSHLSLHPLVMEDIVNIFERIKIEIFEDSIFTILKKLSYNEKNELIEKHINILLFENLVITFLDEKIDIFNPIVDRIKRGKGRIRELGADYLFYSLMDQIIDNHFLVIDSLSNKIEEIEEELVKYPSEEILFKIQHSKRDIIQMRKNVFPLREIINSIIRGDSKLVKNSTQIYFRDAYDHIIRIIETLESYRDMVSGLLDIYLSSTSNKMNEIMKVLTIIATIFIPLTFIAGVYGMNFQYMPELAWKYGYLAIWLIMIIIAIGLIFYFKRKKWL